MGRSKLRALEVAGLRIAIEVPAHCSWVWPTSHAGFACAPEAADISVGVRSADRLQDDEPLRDAFVYEDSGRAIEVGHRGSDWMVRVSRQGVLERIACFDAEGRSGEVLLAPGLAGKRFYPLAAPIEELLVIHRLSREGGLVLRGSAVARGRRALVFLGADPAAASNFCGRSATDVEPIAAQRVLLRPAERGVRVYPAPWDSGMGETPPRSAGVDAIHAVSESPAVHSERIAGPNAVDRIAPHAFAPLHESTGPERVLRNAARLAARVPVLRLGLPRERRVVPFTWGQRQAALSLAPPSTGGPGA